MKKPKPLKQSHSANMKKSSGDWHVSHSSLGMGDNYGSGIRNKVGKVKDSITNSNIPKTKLSRAPKSLA